MASLYVLCGLQCSGKSTKAKQIRDENGFNSSIIISSDEIRKEFPEYENDKVFKVLYKRMNEELAKNKTVIVDATNTTIKSRMKLLENIKHPISVYKICLIINTPYNICLERLRIRNKKENYHFVPENVLKEYYDSFEIPFKEEGWDSICFDTNQNGKTSSKYLNELFSRARYFNQYHENHTQLLGEHLESTYNYINNLSINRASKRILLQSAKYHDIGKLFTQTFKEGDANAHYYSHGNVGVYNLMCYAGILDSWGINTYDTLDWLFYINYHMKMHDIKTSKAKNKWIKIFGEEKFKNLELLHEADCFRPTEQTNQDESEPKVNKESNDDFVEKIKTDTMDLELYMQSIKNRLWNYEPVRANSTSGSGVYWCSTDIPPLEMRPISEIRNGGFIMDDELPY